MKLFMTLDSFYISCSAGSPATKMSKILIFDELGFKITENILLFGRISFLMCY